jgi:hypothetical protein
MLAETLAFLAFVFSVVVMPLGTATVSRDPSAVTRYEWFDATVYAAHADLAGAYFYELEPGDEITAGGQEYSVVEAEIFRALYVRDDGTMEVEAGAAEVLDRDDWLVLQTCWPLDGPPRGVLLVSAEPVEREPYTRWYLPLVVR